ncbi:MAG: phosphoribosylaminoimidazolesuccinocarboxamide synthase [Candidatus Omnitrophota bacterium]|nr:MAG: phosphoribosylaminoimidazolesuccinocarboxamide synthase [Candidatus Omnitrophota bacterium]
MLYETDYKELKLFKKGKVWDVYEFDGRLLIIATDRISCFDVVLPTPIPDKGKMLTQLSLFWFSFLKGTIDNHLISSNLCDLPAALEEHHDELDKRFVITRKCEVVPFECVVRGYISGSGWKEYKQNQKVCAIALPPGLKEADKLPEPIFTPATKAEAGHDINVEFGYMANNIGQELANKIKDISITLYEKAAAFAQSRGILIADTKFEFGMCEGKLILVDEALTSDSSRFWPKEHYKPGGPQVSFDKQFVRDYLESLDWDKSPPAPSLPQDVVEKTQNKYRQALESLAGISL